MIEGGCLCGAVRYKADAKPLVTRVCWCRLCQFLASGNSTVNLAFPSDAVTITGQLKDYQSIADSGHKMHRRTVRISLSSALARWTILKSLTRKALSGRPLHRIGRISIPILPISKASHRPLPEMAHSDPNCRLDAYKVGGQGPAHD